MRLATCAGFVNHRLRRMAPLARPLLAWLFVGAAAVNGMGGEERVDFARQIRPILVSRCFRCHGQLKEESGLRLDRADAMFRGGDRGAALVAGRADESLLLQAVVGTDDLVMPPEGDRLTDEQIALIRRWIDQGAELSELSGGEHWAFVQPVRPPLPSVVRSDWVRNPIDTFLAAEHEKHQLVPASAAPKHILLRRVYLDLIGLPPTPEEVKSFLADDAADAYERVVDDLLARAQYGERWGRHWMDVWRYSDWSGYRNEVRNSQPHIWRWRDWIVGSLNSDKPYDRMILEMLAADEIAPEDDAVLPATGFLVRNWYKFNRNTWLENTVEHTAKSMLGITMGCARCHDHMYDPITQEDYYRFRAFFEAYDVRTDRIPGQADTALDGLPRVYDAKLDAPTYLFVRGDERHPDQSRSLSPALPALFGGEFAIQRVMLPVTARYPALRAFVMSETREAVDAELERAEAGLAAARTALLEQARKTAAAAAAAGTAPDQPETSQPETAAENASTRTLARAEATLLLAEKTQLAARAKRESVLARLAAEQARYATAPGDQTDTNRLAAAAASLQRDAQLAQAERDLLRAEQALSQALDKQRQNPDDAKVSKAAADAKKTLEDAREKRDAALAAKDKAITARNAGQTDTAYEPLGEVYPPDSSGRRSALARWIASRQNPLTARVAINHIWMRHFGEPLVASVFDFGVNGRPPAVPALLDWLAVELMDSQWCMKPIHRLIVTSSAYRCQSWSSGSEMEANLRADPDNRFFWRMNAGRIEAELVRDSVLYVAGELDLRLGGPELDHEAGMTTQRRSLYFRHAYEKQMTFLKLFDAASVEECYRRSESVVPQQALAMANSPLSLAQSRLLAGKLSARTGPHTDADSQFVEAAFLRILGRPPSEAESRQCHEFLAAQTRRLAQDTERLTSFDAGTPSKVKPSAAPHQRARENLVHVLLNHNDFITIR